MFLIVCNYVLKLDNLETPPSREKNPFKTALVPKKFPPIFVLNFRLKGVNPNLFPKALVSCTCFGKQLMLAHLLRKLNALFKVSLHTRGLIT
jgi:hypothetical protein